MYDNKTVIISCAGMGKRLGMGMPKALVEVDGKPLIIRHLEMLKDCKDVRIVVGYKAQSVIDVVKEYRSDVTFVFNHDYMNTGAGASVSLAAKYANEYVIAICGDLLVHPEDTKKILDRSGTFACLCKKSTDNPILATINDNRIVKFSRESGDYEWTGICQFKLSELKDGVGNIHQLFEEFLPADYLLLRVKEIDTPNDYANAVRWVKNNFSDNLTIGILGGMGTVATVEFFDRIVNAFPAEKEWERPRIIIDNRCNMPSRVRAILYNERVNELVYSLTSSIDMMINNNCDYVILACNTAHVFLKEIIEKRPEFADKILNIIELCANELKNNKVKKVKLLASEGTILSGVYSDVFDEYKISIAKTDDKEQKIIRDLIEAVKQHKIDEDTKKLFIDYVNSIKEEDIILGCIELPILYKMCSSKITKNIYDPLQCVINILIMEQENKLK